MIFLAHKYGQLGNRLAYFRVYLSFALEHNVTIFDLAFYEYSKFFKGENTNVVRINSISSCLLRKTLLTLIQSRLLSAESRFLSTVKADSDGHVRLIDDFVTRKCVDSHVVVHEGWPVIDWSLVKKHDDAVKNFFLPVDGLASKVKFFVDRLREESSILIGIHIRQGDYKHWEGGRHYFESSEYVCIMMKILEIHKNAVVKFIVSTNVDQDWELFSGINYVKSSGNAVEDMYILAACDEIYGPKSTFSGWASFFGDVPLCWIEDPQNFSPALKAHE